MSLEKRLEKMGFLLLVVLLPGLTVFAAPPPNLSKPFEEAAKDFEKGHYKQAARFYRIMISTFPGTDWEARAGLYLAQCYEKMGHEDDAKDAYRQVAQAHPGKPEAGEALFHLAEWAEKEGDAEAALTDYEAVTKAAPDTLEGGLALLNGANLQARLRHYPEALEDYTRLGNAENEPVWLRREGFFGKAKIQRLMGQYHEAANAYGQVLSLEPHSPAAAQALLWIGHTHLQAKEYRQAAEDYLKLCQDFPEREAEGWFFAGRAYKLAGSKKEARDTLQKVADLHPDSYWAEDALRLMQEIKLAEKGKIPSNISN